MVFHHHLGTIHPKQLVLVWWSVAKLWREYGISPYFWHYSSKTACNGMMVSCQAMTWIWYFTIILAPFIQNSLGYYKLEYNANVSEAEESNRLQANFPLHSQRRESRTLFSSAIRQAIDRSLQSRNICTLSTSRDHPTACISVIVSCQVMAWIH